MQFEKEPMLARNEKIEAVAARSQPWEVELGRAPNGLLGDAEVVELIHAGSLVVDDIEDGSTIRRGKPALHIRYGLSTALNAGNWLYFWPFQLIRALELPNRTALSVYECYHRTLLRAHFGQAMDLGSRVDRLLQTRVPEVCLATMELKTGALMGFAMMLGAAT